MADEKLSAIATEATLSAGNERLYMVTDIGGTPAKAYIKIGDIVYASATAPSSPEDGFLWHETDTGIIWRYGTYAASSRWVSAASYFSSMTNRQSAATTAGVYLGVASGHNGYDLYLDTLSLKGYVITTNSGSHYWNYFLRKVTTSTAPAASAGTLITSLNTSAQSANAWFDVSASADAVIDGTGTGIEVPFIDVTKTGSPGNIWDSVVVTYRLVHP